MKFEEEWRPIHGFTGLYEVSSWGRVRSLDRIVAGRYGCRSHREGKVLVGGVNNAGYRQVILMRRNKGKQVLVHRLVLTAFYGKCPKGMESRHLDGDKTNNRADNLAWGTRAENIADRWKHHEKYTPNHSNGTLNPVTVRSMRKEHAKGETLDHLAWKYKVTYPTAFRAVHHLSWVEVE